MRSFALCLGLVIGAAAWAGPHDPLGPGFASKMDRLAKLLNRGANRLVIQSSRQVLKANPTATGVRAIMGVALAREGTYAQALLPLEEGAGMPSYERFHGLSAHADSLAAHGRGHEAWALRSTRLCMVNDPRAEVKILVHGVEDLLAAGDVAGAVDLAWWAVSIVPDGAVPHAALAIAYAHDGDWDAVEYHAWLSRSLTDSNPRRLLVVEAWIAERIGQPRLARRAWERVRLGGQATGQTVAWHAAWHRRQGRLDMAEELVNEPKWRKVEHSALFVERAAIYTAQKRRALARRSMARLALLFPTHPGVVVVNPTESLQ